MKIMGLLTWISTFTSRIHKVVFRPGEEWQERGNCLVKHIKHMDLHVPLLSFAAKRCSERSWLFCYYSSKGYYNRIFTSLVRLGNKLLLPYKEITKLLHHLTNKKASIYQRLSLNKVIFLKEGKEIIVLRGTGKMVLMDGHDQENKILTFKCYQDSTRALTVYRL